MPISVSFTRCDIWWLIHAAEADAGAGCSAQGRFRIVQLQQEVADHQLQLRRARECISALAAALADGSGIAAVDLTPCNRFVSADDEAASASHATGEHAASVQHSESRSTDPMLESAPAPASSDGGDQARVAAQAAEALDL